jgi:cytochrome c oxidase subunit 1/cytochrome c oxidase subunit I+III
MFIGFNVAFLPMHLTGLLGMPRRVYTYPADMGWDTLNMITSVGAFVLAVGVLLTFVNVLASLRRGALAGPNPWDAPTLEWSVPSPPPPYNFAVLPTVASRHPLWEDRLGEGRGRSSIDRGLILDHDRETIGTTALDSEPDVILKMPFDSPAPFILTLGTAAIFVGLLIPSQLFPLTIVGCLIVVAAILIWLWPERVLGQTVEPAP